MPHRLLYYVSGHGFGHARRATQVIRAIQAADPIAEVFVRSAAPARAFRPLPAERITPSAIDAGMAEEGPLCIDPEGSLARLESLIARRDTILGDELAAVRDLRPDVIVADIPFLAGEVAAAADLQCVGISNFTWDWIYDGLLTGDPGRAARYQAVRPIVERGYRQMALLLRMPFGRTSPAFGRTIDIPLVAAQSERNRDEALGEIGIDPSDPRPRVLIGMRGGISPDVLMAAAAESPGWLFFIDDTPPAGSPGNIRPIGHSPALDFLDVLAVCDVVVSKLGYGIVSDCIAAGVALLWPRRVGFREDEVMEVEAARSLRLKEIPVTDFATGRWKGAMRQILGQAPPSFVAPIDGSAHVAKLLKHTLA